MYSHNFEIVFILNRFFYVFLVDSNITLGLFKNQYLLLWTHWHKIMRQLDLSLMKISQYKFGGKLLYLNHTLLLFRRPNIQGYNSTEECLCWNLWPRRRWTGRKTCKLSKLKNSLSPRIPWRSFDQNLWPFMTYCLNCLNIVCATSLHFYCWKYIVSTKQGIISNQGLHNCECLCWNSKS